MNYTKNMGLRKPEGGEYYSIEDFNNNVDTLDAVVSGKADKPTSFTQGNLAAVGANGSLADSGNKPADFAEAEHSHDVAYAPISHVSDKTVHVNANEKAAIASMGSKADRTYVDSALSTKANIGNTFNCQKGAIPQNLDVRTWAEQQNSSTTQCSGFGTGFPHMGDWMVDLFLYNNGWGWKRLVITSLVPPHTTYISTKNISEAWSEWTPLASSIPPQEFNLPVVNGFYIKNKSTYFKTQENLCVINFNVECATGASGIRLHIATLPQGLYPAQAVLFPTAGKYESTNIAGWGILETDGKLYVDFAQAVKAMSGNVIYKIG